MGLSPPAVWLRSLMSATQGAMLIQISNLPIHQRSLRQVRLSLTVHCLQNLRRRTVTALAVQVALLFQVQVQVARLRPGVSDAGAFALVLRLTEPLSSYLFCMLVHSV
jgi:hypothetical protein